MKSYFIRYRHYFVFLWPQLSNLTRNKVDKFVNKLNYVSHAKAQDGTKNAQEIKLLKSFILDIHRQLKSNFELDVFYKYQEMFYKVQH